MSTQRNEKEIQKENEKRIFHVVLEAELMVVAERKMEVGKNGAARDVWWIVMDIARCCFL